MKTMVASPFEDDAAELLKWAYGDNMGFQMRLFVSGGQRVGQAFMNTLWMCDQVEHVRLANSEFDPFYDDKLLRQALDFLTTT